MVASPESVQFVLDTCRLAAQANLDAAARRGRMISLDHGAADELMITADLHGNRLNFQRLLQIADLDAYPGRHLVVQEVCHGGPGYPHNAGCMSHLLLEDVMAMKVAYPERFHFLLSNHELAEVTDLPIAKAGKMLNLQFRAGLSVMYGEAAGQVRQGYLGFLSSCPLAIRLANGVFVSHGSPAKVLEEGFDADVFQREGRPEDLQAGGEVYRLVWGRDFRAENAAAFARVVDASVLIHGHEPCDQGFQAPNDIQVILDCCHRNGCYVIVPVAEPTTHQHVVQSIRRLYDTDHVQS